VNIDRTAPRYMPPPHYLCIWYRCNLDLRPRT